LTVSVSVRRAAFLDRDGPILVDDGYLRDASTIGLTPGAAEALRALARDHLLVVVSNQSGVARGIITKAELAAVDARMKELLEACGVRLDAVYYCEHGPDDGCECRKPRPGMLLRAAREHGIDLVASVMIGDKPSDVEAGRAAGVRAAILFTGDWPRVLAAVQDGLGLRS
jgi:histidinol-phosphate phosphatase family protein